jgi:hypothetical protein
LFASDRRYRDAKARTDMPTISFFYGIAIRMYFRDHAPPYFHAVYGEHEAFVSIETGEILAGYLPKTAIRLVGEWALARRTELRENWHRAQQSLPLERVAGLQDD